MLIHEEARTPLATLETQLENFEPGKHEGLLAVTSDSPGMRSCVGVYEETEDVGPRPIKEFVVNDKRLIKEKSAKHSRWSVRVVTTPRDWTWKPQFMIANEHSQNEVLVQKLYNLGPVAIAQTFD
ncbi:MAG: hypothetical protein HY043_16985 [Verrucomicrobia bacterium]|nr:hypothetical protein [Verrucomicrobiota bacterium]